MKDAAELFDLFDWVRLGERELRAGGSCLSTSGRNGPRVDRIEPALASEEQLSSVPSVRMKNALSSRPKLSRKSGSPSPPMMADR